MIVMFIALNRRILSKNIYSLPRPRAAAGPAPLPDRRGPSVRRDARREPERDRHTHTRQHCLRPGGARTTPTTSTLGYGPLCFALHLSFRVVHLLPLCSLSALYFLAPLLSSSHLRTSQIKHP